MKFLLFFLLCFSPFYGMALDGVQVDLLDPLYSDGVLSTQRGGVLCAPGLRIQAQNITYIKKTEGDTPLCTVCCSGDLLIDYGDWTLTGESLFYDFLAKKGELVQGRTADPPWYIGGENILLMDDGSLVVLDGFLTTSEGEIEDLAVRSSHICIAPNHVITAKNITVDVYDVPIFWLPFLKLDLQSVDRFPFSVRFGWGGFLGSYLSFLYRFLTIGPFEATARFDIFFGKGVGLGIETAFEPDWGGLFYTRNYYAYDIPLDDPVRQDRYRFQGSYCDCLADIEINGIYDVVSDAEMAQEYTTQDFNLETAGRTQLELRRQTDLWIATLFTRVRVNTFQSVNQHLPSFQLNWHPLIHPQTGIIVQNTFNASYLDYVFSKDVPNGVDFSAGRISVHPLIYRPLFFGPVTATPEAGLIGIAYSNSKHEGKPVGLAAGQFGLKVESALTKCSALYKHVVEPYLHYTYLTSPTVNPDRHSIFTINDGIARLNQLKFGLRNSLFVKTPCTIIRPLWVNLWANAFFDTPSLPRAIPRGYLSVEWMPTERLAVCVNGAWLFPAHQIDFYNARMDWTCNENLAIGIEYRHRSRFDWRKGNFDNFILDSFRTPHELLHSPLSDQNDTLLFRIFSRLNPNWTAKFDLRHGWHRRFQSPYLEYLLEVSRVVFQHFRLTFTVDKRECDPLPRFSFSLLMDPGP